MFAFKERNQAVQSVMAMVPCLVAVIALLSPLASSARIIIKPPPPPPPPVYTPPSTPGNFQATAVTKTSISFAWSPSTPGTDSKFVYVINELSPSDGFSMNVGDVTSFNWDFVEQSTTYTFEIYAIDSNNHASAPSAPITVTTPPTPIIPAAPVITATASTPTTITVNWAESTPSSDLQGFFLDVSNGGTSVVFNSTNPAEATSATIEGLFANTTYAIEVVAASATFDYSTSQVVSVTTTVSSNNIPPTAPTSLTVTYDPGTGLPDLSWNASTSPYEPSSQIQYWVVIDVTQYVAGIGVESTTAIDQGDSPPPGQTSSQYLFAPAQGTFSTWVIAVDQYGNVSPPSNVVSVSYSN
jgi:hypothetical protein